MLGLSCVDRNPSFQRLVSLLPKPIRLVNVCRASMFRYMGFTGIVGHEFVGVVEKVDHSDEDSQVSALLGKRVVGEINLGKKRFSGTKWCACRVHMEGRKSFRLSQRFGAPVRLDQTGGSLRGQEREIHISIRIDAHDTEVEHDIEQ